MLCNYDQKKKLHILYLYFLNMDISLIIPLKCLKFSIHVCEIQMEGTVSQNYDKDLSFCFIVCRRWHFAKKYIEKILKITRFLS